MLLLSAGEASLFEPDNVRHLLPGVAVDLVAMVALWTVR